MSKTQGLDMTVGAEWRHILLFSLPIMAGNLLQQLYNTVDGIVVGNYVSQEALAATGSAGTLAMLFLAAAIGLGNGAGIMLAQLFGARRTDSIRTAATTSLLLLLGIGAALSVFGFFASRLLFSALLNVAEGETLDLAVAYFRVYSLGFVLQFAYNTVAALLRSLGDSRATLVFLLVSAVVNLVLDLLFVIVFHWGVVGAAVATVVSQLASTAVSFVYMYRRYPLLRPKRGAPLFRGSLCALCLRLGIPATVQQCIVGFGNVFVQRLINSFGSATMAAFTAGNRVENYLFVPAVGFNNGMATFAAQNTGARKPERIRRGLFECIVMSFAICVALSVCTWIFAPGLGRLFGLDSEALTQTIGYNRFLSWFFWTFACYMPLAGMLQGTGDVNAALICSLVTLGIRVALAYVFAGALGWGYAGIWRAMPIGWASGGALALIRYFTGAWKRKGITDLV